MGVSLGLQVTPLVVVVHNWEWAYAIGVPFLRHTAVFSEVRLYFGTRAVAAAAELQIAPTRVFLPAPDASVGGSGAYQPSVSSKQYRSDVSPTSLPVATSDRRRCNERQLRKSHGRCMIYHLGMELASPDLKERPCGGTSKKSMWGRSWNLHGKGKVCYGKEMANP